MEAPPDELVPPLPTSIKPIPTTFISSLSAWWGLSRRQTAEAELHLYKASGLFQGAVLGNAAHVTDDGPDGIAQAFYIHPRQENRRPIPRSNAFATVAKQLATSEAVKGKVGCIRNIHLHGTKTGTWIWPRYASRYIHMLEIGTPIRKIERPKDEMQIVVVHGYGAGGAYFFRNIRALASIPNSRLYCLDWLGMGCSSRSPYRMRGTAPRTQERVEASETFFLEALEEWRDKMQIEKMVLVGHSLGGYLSTAYALKHPERVSKLVLVSPAGFPDGTAKEIVGNDPRVRRFGPRTLRFMGWLWDRNVSPFGILRASTVFGPMIMGMYTRRRFQTLTPEELQALHAYCHGIFTAKSSSEQCLCDILAPGAFARYPLVHRVAPLRMPMVFLYGEHDWMDRAGADQAQAILHEAGNHNVQVHTVSRAGHHLYLDNPAEFGALVQEVLAS